MSWRTGALLAARRVRPAASATQRAYGAHMADVLHHTYLPFTADQLREHFAPVLGPGEWDRHLRYYLASVEEARKYDEPIRRGDRPTPAQTRLGRQMEKDERFWLATALMSLHHADGGSGRVERVYGALEVGPGRTSGSGVGAGLGGRSPRPLIRGRP